MHRHQRDDDPDLTFGCNFYINSIFYKVSVLIYYVLIEELFQFVGVSVGFLISSFKLLDLLSKILNIRIIICNFILHCFYLLILFHFISFKVSCSFAVIDKLMEVVSHPRIRLMVLSLLYRYLFSLIKLIKSGSAWNWVLL